MGIKSYLVGKVVDFVKPHIKAELTAERIADIGCTGIDRVASHGLENVSDEKLGVIAKGCVLGSSVLGNVAAAVDPSSDGGRAISPTEREAIKRNLRESVNCIVTQEQIDKAIDEACARIVQRYS